MKKLFLAVPFVIFLALAAAAGQSQAGNASAVSKFSAKSQPTKITAQRCRGIKNCYIVKFYGRSLNQIIKNRDGYYTGIYTRGRGACVQRGDKRMAPGKPYQSGRKFISFIYRYNSRFQNRALFCASIAGKGINAEFIHDRKLTSMIR
jgi:hypothetical protein